jgi:hypothetical protein
MTQLIAISSVAALAFLVCLVWLIIEVRRM